MDGGIRRGSDILKAVALGADAVLLGRPYAYGLAVGGQAGVEAVIRQLAAELDITLALIGGRAVRDLDSSAVAGSPGSGLESLPHGSARHARRKRSSGRSCAPGSTRT